MIDPEARAARAESYQAGRRDALAAEFNRRLVDDLQNLKDAGFVAAQLRDMLERAAASVRVSGRSI